MTLKSPELCGNWGRMEVPISVPRDASTSGGPTTTYEGSDRMSKSICSFTDCANPVRSLGLCNGHAQQRRKGRELRPLRIFKDPSRRFWSKVEKADGCWEWTGSRHASGYGRINLSGTVVYAHRFAYQDTFGEIPDGLMVRHKCDNPPCVNPDHLEVGSVQDNSNDMVTRGRSLVGEKHPMAVLTDQQVLEIRKLWRTTPYDILEIAKRSELNEATVRAVVNGESWNHLGEYDPSDHPPKYSQSRAIDTETGVEMVRLYRTSSLSMRAVAKEFGKPENATMHLLQGRRGYYDVYALIGRNE